VLNVILPKMALLAADDKMTGPVILRLPAGTELKPVPARKTAPAAQIAKSVRSA
jgi:hypothetical protein